MRPVAAVTLLVCLRLKGLRQPVSLEWPEVNVGSSIDFGFVEGFASKRLFEDAIQLAAVLCKQPARLSGRVFRS